MTARDLLRRVVDTLLPLEDGRVEPFHGMWEFDHCEMRWDSVDGKEWADQLLALRTEAQTLLDTEDPLIPAARRALDCLETAVEANGGDPVEHLACKALREALAVRGGEG